jgi:soluble lytic murein transglycosylase-like protein
VTVREDLAAVERRVAQFEPVHAVRSSAAIDFARAVRGSLDELIRREARTAGLDPALVTAVIANESGFDAHATSRAGAAGLMQLMPATAAALGVTDRYDPVQNVRAGATYLRSLMERFGADLPSVLAAYNAGPGAVEMRHGPPPFPETQRYVARVLATYRALLGR